MKNGWKNLQLAHERIAFIRFWNSSIVNAESGFLKKDSHRSSNNFLSSSETCPKSNSSPIDDQSSSINCNFLQRTGYLFESLYSCKHPIRKNFPTATQTRSSSLCSSHWCGLLRPNPNAPSPSPAPRSCTRAANRAPLSW